MNFSTIEDSVLKEKKKFSNFLSRFLKNSRILIILLTATVITAVSVSIWIKSPEYQVLYNNLSNEDGGAIINELNKMHMPYQLTDISGQISVPKNKVYEVRLHLAANNLPKNRGVGFELLDQEKFGISRFHEKINYQRALEGELARTIQKMKMIKDARVHISFPESSLFLQNQKESSASVIVELNTGYQLNLGQINAILHLISDGVTNLPIKNITIVDQLGTLLNHTSFKYDQINNIQLKYSEDIESRYKNRIKNILEPLVGKGNIYAQVTAQIDFNLKEQTQEKYSPNTNRKDQSIRSHQTSVHDKTKQLDASSNLSHSNNNLDVNNKKNMQKELNSTKNNSNINHHYTPIDTTVTRDNTTNYELNHSILHTKMNIGEVKRLSAAVIINVIKDKNGNVIPFTPKQIKNFEQLTREAIGFSKIRGDSIHIVNESFVKNEQKLPILVNHVQEFESSNSFFVYAPWIFSFLFLICLLKKYIFPTSNKKNNFKNINVSEENKHIKKTNDLEKDIFQFDVQKNKNLDQLIHQIGNISNQNPRTIALIIRKWMSDKI